MDDITKLIIMAIFQIFGMFVIGWFARYKGYLDEIDVNKWSKLILDLLYPLLIFNSICRGYNLDKLKELWFLPIISFSIILFGAILGFLLKKGVKSRNENVIKTFHYFCAINNTGFLALIIVKNLWGNEAVANLLFFNLGASVAYWTIGIALLSESKITKAFKNILTPNLIALFFALLLVITGINAYIPETVYKISESGGNTAIPLMLILLGAVLYPFPKINDIRDLVYLSVVRLILLPCITISIISLLPLDYDIKKIVYVVALMPASMAAPILTRKYGGDPDFASKGSVITTVCSIVTIPIGLMLLL